MRLSPGAAVWSGIAQAVDGFLRRHGIRAPDAVVLLPFAQHLPLARAAWARLNGNGWMPRFETTHTLAVALGGIPPHPAPGVTLDAGIDRLTASQMLSAQSWGAAERRRDARSFDAWVRAVVATAHGLCQAAAALPPEAREAFWGQARSRSLATARGTGFQEAALISVAVEWGAASSVGSFDALLAYANRAAGWVVARVGGPDPVAGVLLQRAAGGGVPCLTIDCDPSEGALFDAADFAEPPALVPANGFEDEAQRAAAQVLSHIAQGRTPVALVAQDRVLVRRIRALLESRRIPIRDETGWKLSTTRAAACVMGMLRLCAYRAGVDEMLDWLKSAWVGLADAVEVDALESALRWRQVSRVDAVHADDLEGSALSVWQRLRPVRSSLADGRSRTVRGWCESLRLALQQAAAWERLSGDAAGTRVLVALRLNPGSATTSAFDAMPMSLGEFTQWADEVLESVTYAPAPPSDAPVAVLPLARLMLRPFAAVVMPGCDDRRLGAAPVLPGLWSERDREALGLPTRAQALKTEALAFAHALRMPSVSCFWRLHEDGEPLNPSPLLEAVRLGLARAGRHAAAWQDPREVRAMTASAVSMPAPAAPALLPAQINATSYEALRACPYRFFALRMLRLEETQELEAGLEKRDYGTWLHAVLRRFHERRGGRTSVAEDLALLVRIGREVQQDMALDEAEFMPFQARFPLIAQLYVDWLARHEGDGGRFQHAELALSVSSDSPSVPAMRDQIPPIQFTGQIDRVDVAATAEQRTVWIMDYKTEAAQGLKGKVKQPLEDTQLPFYALLLEAARPQLVPAGSERVRLRAAYLALDGKERIEQIEHPDVADDAAQLMQGMAQDLARIARGAGLPALGEGRVCEFCAARGLCRKDHWAEVPVTTHEVAGQVRSKVRSRAA